VSNRYNFFFRQVVQENEMDDVQANLEFADQDMVADLEFGQQASDVGVSAYDLTTNPTLTADNKQALLGGIHNGLTCSITPVPSVGAPKNDLKITVKAGTAHDCRGRRIVVGYKHDPTTGRQILTNPTYIVDCAAAGVTPVGEGGSTSGGATVTPSAGQTRWLTLGVQFDRLLLNPKVDGNAATVFTNLVESFRFSVKAGPATSGTPVAAPPDSDVIILGDFLIDSAGHVIGQDFKRRGDWIRTTIGITGDPSLIATEEGSDPTHFVERNTRKAILRILRQASGVAGDLGAHTNQSSPALRHHAKNIDVDVTDAEFPNGTRLPDFTIDGHPIVSTIVGGGTNADGVQYVLNNLVTALSNQSLAAGTKDGTGYIGCGPIDGLLGNFVEPISWNGGALGGLLFQMVNAINRCGSRDALNNWLGTNLFTTSTFFTSPAVSGEAQIQLNVGSMLDTEKAMGISFGTGGDAIANIHIEAQATGHGTALSFCRNCYWDNVSARWTVVDSSKPAVRLVLATDGLLIYSRTDTTGLIWTDDETVTGWDKKIHFFFVGSGSALRTMLIGPDSGSGPNIFTNTVQSMQLGWEGFHPAGASGPIGGTLNFRFTYALPPSSITALSLASTNVNISGNPAFSVVTSGGAYWSANPTVPGAHTKLHRHVAIVP
jgi:hypothetical protein